MNFLQKKTSISFRIFAGTLVVTVVITLILSTFSLFSRQALLKQASDNNTVYAELLAGQLDHSLQELQKYLENIYFLDDNFRHLVSEDNPNERYLYSQDIMLEAANYLPLYSYGIMLYITAPGLKSPVVSTLPRSADTLAFSDYFNTLRNTSENHIDMHTTGGYFTPVEIADQNYLFLCYERNNVHAGVFVDLQSLLETVKYSEDIGSTRISLGDSSRNILSEAAPEHIMGKRTIVSESPLSSASLILFVETPQRAFLKRLNLFQFFLIGITVLAVLVFLLWFIYQQQKVYRPLQELRNTLRKIDQGDLDTKLDPENRTRELSDIYRTINTYIDHVTDLRTQTYEERLNRQNIEMQFLQLQLRPHFFLNSLKSIYALAENKEFTEIQEYVLCLSTHFRFLLYDTTKRIELKKELLHTQNYMKMQRIGLHKPDISCTMQISGVNENSLVPPLILQTFMENSIKYALLPNQPLEMIIQVQTAEMEEGKPLLNFSFRDNGPGFPQEILNEMEQDEENFFLHHKGFGNLKRRLNLIYPEGAEIFAYNYPSGGAAVDILIPCDTEESVSTEAKDSGGIL